MRVAWTLEEIGLSYEATVISVEEAGAPPHLARHPLGRVPVLERDGQTLFESTAICLALADEHPHASLIAPIGSPARALIYQWAIFAMTEVEPAAVEVLRYRESDPPRGQAGRVRFDAAANAFEDALEGREHLVGDSFTVADIVAGGVLAIGRLAGLTADHPNVSAYLDRLTARQAYRRAVAATESSLAS